MPLWAKLSINTILYLSYLIVLLSSIMYAFTSHQNLALFLANLTIPVLMSSVAPIATMYDYGEKYIAYSIIIANSAPSFVTVIIRYLSEETFFITLFFASYIALAFVSSMPYPLYLNDRSQIYFDQLRSPIFIGYTMVYIFTNLMQSVVFFHLTYTYDDAIIYLVANTIFVWLTPRLSFSYQSLIAIHINALICFLAILQWPDEIFVHILYAINTTCYNTIFMTSLVKFKRWHPLSISNFLSAIPPATCALCSLLSSETIYQLLLNGCRASLLSLFILGYTIKQTIRT